MASQVIGAAVSQLHVLENFIHFRDVTMLTWKSGLLSWEKYWCWYERLQTLMISYKPEDKWNTDETVCFFR